MNWQRILIGKWNWKRPILSLLSIYLMLGIVAVFFADRIIFLPPPPSYTVDKEHLAHIQTAEDESIAFIHLKAAPTMPTVLISHGNAEDLADSDSIYKRLHQLGIGIIAYDYPGYGLSTGRPNEESCQRAIMAMWRHLLSSGTPPSSIVILGRSVGSGPSVWLASEVKPAGLVLLSPFKSTFTTAFDLPFPLFPRDRFPNLDRIRTILHPLLIIHGETDEVIPAKHGETLFFSSPSKEKSLLILPKTGHNDLFELHENTLVEAIGNFAKNVTK
jgi:pimeloyl-ACP methyl ester carboxylesterase